MLSRRKKSGGNGNQSGSITVKVMPASGTGQDINVNVPSSGASLEEVLKGAKLTGNGMLVAINGEPADKENAKRYHVPAGATVTLTERARGS
jgi:hypothetical protein